MSEVSQKVNEQEAVRPYSCSPRGPRSVLSPCGDKYQVKTRYYVKDGEELAEPGEKVDWDAYIQSSKSSCDIVQIIERYKAGDETVLNVNPNGFYGDVSIIPQNVNDIEKIYKMSETARENYDKLPQIAKDAFGSPENFFNAVLNNKAEDIIKSIKVEEKKD